MRTGAGARRAHVINAPDTTRALGRYVRKLGNAVGYRDSRGELVLLYASVAIGGWSGASINLMRSTDDGETWSAPRRLVTSPLFNISTLVRGPPVPMRDGSVMVPTYDELTAPYSTVLVLAVDGRVIGHRRIGGGRNALQPVIVRFDERSARSYMRARRLQFAQTSDTADAGFSWSNQIPMDIPSLDNPVAVERLGGDHLLLSYNAPDARGTGPLSLALSADRGRTWRLIHSFEHDRGVGRYPWLMSGPDGHYHLFYTRTTGQGSEIVHVRFGHGWLAARGGPPCR